MSNENTDPTHVIVATVCPKCSKPPSHMQPSTVPVDDGSGGCQICKDGKGFVHETITIEALAEILRKKELI